MTQHTEPHRDPRLEERSAEADDNWLPPEPGDQATLDQQPDPERADWMPPLEHRPPSILDEDPAGDQPVRTDPTATMLPPADPSATPPAIPPSPASGRTTPPVANPSVAPAAPAEGMAPMPDPLWPDAEVARFEGRWREVQLGFVDDPRHAADEARSLLDEVMDRLTRAISDRRQELDTWRDGNGNSNGGDDTESMLAAVRRYRRLMDQLLAVGGPR